MGSFMSIEPQVILSLIWYLITVVITKAVVTPGRPLARTLLAAPYRDDGGAAAVTVHTVPPRWLRVLPNRILCAPLAPHDTITARPNRSVHTAQLLGQQQATPASTLTCWCRGRIHANVLAWRRGRKATSYRTTR